MRVKQRALALAGCLLVQCDARPVTSVVLRFDSDVAPERVDRVDVAISWVDTGEELARRFVTQPMDAASIFPGTLLVAPSGARAGRLVRVDARLFSRDERAPFVISRTQFAMPSSGTRVHDVFFADACGTSGTSALCTARESCVVVGGAPRCVPVPTQEPLPLYDPNAQRDAGQDSGSIMDGSASIDAALAADAQADGTVSNDDALEASMPPSERPTWFPWHGARLSAGVVSLRWDRALAPMGAVIVLCPGFSCTATPERLATSDGVLRTRDLNPGLYNWYVESQSGARLSPTRVFLVRDLQRPTDLEGVALGTTLWIDATDGDPDWAVSRPGAGARGTVTVTTAMRRQTTLTPPPSAVGSRFGSALANAGDPRGRGSSSIAVASGASASEPSFVALFDSATNALASAPSELWTGVAGERFGEAIAGGGDLDGDGFADLLIGAPGARGGAGLVRVVFGGASAPSITREDVASGSAALGSVLASGCDFDGDSFADYATASAGAGRFVLVRYGGPRGASARTVRIDPPAGMSDSEFAAALSCQGDSDGDGRADLAVGAPAARMGARSVGAVVIYALTHERATVTNTLYGTRDNGRFGDALVLQRDYSSDDRDDVIVASPGAGTVELIHLGTSNGRRLALTSGATLGARVALSSGSTENVSPFASEALAGVGAGAGALFRLSPVNGFGIVTANEAGAGADNFGAAVAQ